MVSLVPTSSARTPGSQMLKSTPWPEMADMARLSGSRPFAVKPAAPRPLPDATPPCEEKLPTAQAGSRHTRDAAWDRCRSHGRPAEDGLLRTAEHRFH